MNKEKLTGHIELFICNHKRSEGEDCASKGSKELTDQIKTWAKESSSGKIKVFRSGCLGKCSEGIISLCYPEKFYLTQITENDSNEIKEGLIEALEKLKSN